MEIKLSYEAQYSGVIGGDKRWLYWWLDQRIGTIEKDDERVFSGVTY